MTAKKEKKHALASVPEPQPVTDFPIVGISASAGGLAAFEAFFSGMPTMQSLFDAIAAPTTEHPPELWVRFFEHVAEYGRLYSALLGRKGSPWFVKRMRVTLVDLLKQYQRLATGHLPPDRAASSDVDDFIPTLLAAMLAEAIAWWLEQKRPYPPQEIAN